MADFATVQDVIQLKRPLTGDEVERASKLIPIVCSSLRTEAKKRGRDLDEMVSEDEDLAAVAKSVTVDVVMRELMTSTNQEPMTQYSEAAMGYSVSGSFLSPGGGLFIKNTELKRLGLTRQRYGKIDPFGIGGGDIYVTDQGY